MGQVGRIGGGLLLNKRIFTNALVDHDSSWQVGLWEAKQCIDYRLSGKRPEFPS
jgi:hypothetical protein